MNCTGKRCIMQFDKVDPATCQCVSYCPQATPPKTNADRIRSMSDDELAEFCFCITDDVASYYGGDGYEQKYPVASKGWLNWLKKEAENGNR